MIRLILIFFISFDLKSENLTSVTLFIDHHGKIEKIADKKNKTLGFYKEEASEIPEFSSEFLQNYFYRLSSIIPESTILILSANDQGVVTSVRQSKRNPSLNLSHTDIEGHSHPESLPLNDISIKVPLKVNQSSIYLFLKTRNKLAPLGKVTLK